MKTCSTCKHWYVEQIDEDDEWAMEQNLIGVGLCKAAKLMWDYREWREDSERMEFTKEGESIMMFCQDGSDYRANLFTRSGHFCGEWMNETN